MNRTNRLQVLVFDFDGVILESVTVKERAIFHLFEGVSIEDRQRALRLHQQTPGIDRQRRIRLLFKEVFERDPLLEEVEILLKRFEKLVWDGLVSCPEVPGIRDFLNALDGISCYVVSASPKDELRDIAIQRDFFRYFVAMFGTPPEKVDLLRSIMEKEKVGPQYMLFIGDKISDYWAAQEVGAEFIGRETPKNATHFPDDIFTIPDFSSIDVRELIFAE